MMQKTFFGWIQQGFSVFPFFRGRALELGLRHEQQQYDAQNYPQAAARREWQPMHGWRGYR